MIGLEHLQQIGKDLSYGARILWRAPGFTAVALISLALGIGANTAIFSLIDGLWTRPLAVPRPGQIVRIFSVTNQASQGLFSFPEYKALQEQGGSFHGIVARGGRGVQIPNGDGSSDLLLVNVVSANFFDVLGVKPAAGRLFSQDEEAGPGIEPVVVLGNSFWRRRFGGDAGIVARQIELSRGAHIPFTVIGVLPESFRETDPGSDRDLWFPPQSWVRLAGSGDFEKRGFRWFQVLGRLAAEASVETATAQVQTIARRLADDWPATNAGRSALVMSDFRYRLQAAGASAIALLVIVLLVVLLCSVNVANLLLARGAARSREIGIRLALGAGRLRLVSQLMTENLLLGLIGLWFGLLIGSELIKLLPHLLVMPPGFTVPLDFLLDQRVLMLAGAVSFVTIALFGLIPAFRALSPQLVPALKSGTDLIGDGSGRRLLLRHWLVIAQVSISLMLLIATGVLAASFANTRTADIGITRKPLLLEFLEYDSGAKSTYQEAVERMRELPAVKGVAFALRAPLSLSGNGYAQKVTFPDLPEMKNEPPVEIKFNSISSNYLRVMGTALRKGREFTEFDQTTGPPVAIVNEIMAETYWPGQDPIDRLIHIEGEHGGDYRIVGVVQTSPINAIGETPEPYLYLPFSRTSVPEITLMIQTEGEALPLAQTVRKTLISIDHSLDPLSITTQQQLTRFSAGQYQTTAELVSVLAFLGLILTAIGLYGVVSYGIDRRTREIGIRMALGAERNNTMALILKETLLMGGIGCAVGLPLALTATRLAQALLFGVSPWNLYVIVAAVTTLALVLLLAGGIPARRATRIEPATALRCD